MDNPTQCNKINNSIINTNSYPGPTLEKGTGISISHVNNRPLSQFHIQQCYRNSTTTAQVFITEPYGTQQEYSTALTFTPGKLDFWYVLPSAAGIKITVALTLVDSYNNEVIVQIETYDTGVIKYISDTIQYRNCNDINIISSDILQAGQYIVVGCIGHGIRTVIGSTFKYTPLFMCCNSTDGTPRNARLIGLPQIYSAVATNFRMFKWTENYYGSTPVYSIFAVNATVESAPSYKNRIYTKTNGQVNLQPGECVAWWRSTSTNAIAAVTATWEYYNMTT
jgi:hypothetical protein